MNQRFIDTICEKEDILPHIVNQIYQDDIPLVMYGKGPYAKMIYNILKENDIQLSAVVSDSGYFRIGDYFMEFPIQDISVLKNYKKCNIIIAFAIFREYHENYWCNWIKLVDEN